MESPYYPSVSTIEKKGLYPIRPSHSKKWFNIIYIYPHLMLQSQGRKVIYLHQTLSHKTLSQSYPSTFREKENLYPTAPFQIKKEKTYAPSQPPTIRERNLCPITPSHNQRERNLCPITPSENKKENTYMYTPSHPPKSERETYPPQHPPTIRKRKPIPP